MSINTVPCSENAQILLPSSDASSTKRKRGGDRRKEQAADRRSGLASTKVTKTVNESNIVAKFQSNKRDLAP